MKTGVLAVAGAGREQSFYLGYFAEGKALEPVGEVGAGWMGDERPDGMIFGCRRLAGGVKGEDIVGGTVEGDADGSNVPEIGPVGVIMDELAGTAAADADLHEERHGLRDATGAENRREIEVKHKAGAVIRGLYFTYSKNRSRLLCGYKNVLNKHAGCSFCVFNDKIAIHL